MARSQARVWLTLLVLALCALPVSAEVFHVTLTNGSVIDTAYQPQQASWDPNMVLLLAETGNWVGFQRDEIDSIRAEDPTQGFGVRISDKRISLGVSPNDLPAPDAGGSRQDNLNDRSLQLAERALALAEKQQTYSIQQGVSTENTQGIPSSFAGSSYGGGGNSLSGLGGLLGGLGTTNGGSGDTVTPGTVVPPDTVPNP